MKKLLLVFCAICVHVTTAIENVVQPTHLAESERVHKILEQKLTHPEPDKQSNTKKHVIKFNYEREPLVDIINFLSAEKGVNVVLPAGNDAIKSTVTLTIEQALSLDEAWDILYTLLDVAGYSMIPHADLYMISKNNKEMYREPLPVYVGTPIDKLPESDERIRYIAYLSNIEVSSEPTSTLATLLNQLLTDTAKYQIDELTNALIISDKSSNIRSIMRTILAIDQTNFQEKLEIIKLRYVDAATIVTLFNTQILETAQQAQRYQLHRAKPHQGKFFPENIRLVDIARTNALVLLGKVEAVDRVKNFIYKYIDVELESGDSVLHVYQLQYLDAEDLVPVLRQIIESTRGEQAATQAQAGKTVGGVRRMFEGVIITSDKPENVEVGKYSGGNKLVVAARKDDWHQIKKLIEELDVPQSQVIIEVLIADLSIDDIRSLGTIFRNPAILPLEGNVNFQSAQAGPVILDSTTEGSVTNPTTVKSDLLGKVFTDSASTPVSVASGFPAGSTVFSFSDSDGKTWGLASLLKRLGSRKVLSHPHVVAINNQKARIKIGELRLVPGPGSGSTGGTTTALKVPIPANLEIIITPRISSADSVNLNIVIKIEDFKSANIGDADKFSREVRTNTEVTHKEILSLGGLTRIDTEQDKNGTPLLSQIPIIGWFFKRRANTNNKTSLTVFISPTIIQPRLRGGVGEYTRDYISLATQYSQEGSLFESLKDPITRWFFAPDANNATETIEDFAGKDESSIIRDMYAQKREEKTKKRIAKEQGSKLMPSLATLVDLSDNTTHQTQDQTKQQEIVTPEEKKKQEQELISLIQNTENPLLNQN